jgi:serine/threonine-protein kinase
MTPPVRIAHYRITAKLGEGGMGAVYRAIDTKLNREVAIKILPDALANDPDYLARFTREAQVLASLNHPNIAVIYGVEEKALVMELVPGQTLEERLAAGPIPLGEALDIARQIAEALEAAHEKGVVHRDLKPANVKVTPEGVAKVLDFGLAKSTESTGVAASGADSPTLTIRATQAGIIMGTAAYMAPEQAAGKPVDKRADIWSFGVVLYEMLSGQRLFEGETIAHTLADVLRADIDLGKLPASAPALVRSLVGRCLDRNIKTRLRDIGEARIALGKALTEPAAEAASATAAAPRHRALAYWLAGACALIAVAAAAIAWRAGPPGTLHPLVQVSVEMSADGRLAIGNLATGDSAGLMALSPDGTRIVAVLRGSDGTARLYTRLLSERQLVPIAGTENGDAPFFSPDGRWIGFREDTKVKKLPVEGGVALPICDAPILRGASWGDDGSIVLALTATSPLSRVSSSGGVPQPVTQLKTGERTHRWPQVLPGSRTILFTANTQNSDYDNANIEAVSTATGERKMLVRGGHSGRYLATADGRGWLIYLHSAVLYGVPFDLKRLAVTGPAIPMVYEVSSNPAAGAVLTFSRDGTLAYLLGKAQQGYWNIILVDPSGETRTVDATPGVYLTPRFSPDGKRLAYAMVRGTSSDIWVRDLDRDTASRLTFLQGANGWPAWTPDGRYIIFHLQNPGMSGLYWIRADGAGEAQRLTDGKVYEHPYAISPDGKRLVLGVDTKDSNEDLFAAAIEGDPTHPKLGKMELLVGTSAVEAYARLSPDGRWLAYASNQTGDFEVYVQPFPGPGGRWQISTEGGLFPAWSRAGRELLYESRDHRVMAVSYTTQGNSFAFGKPHAWSDARVANLGTTYTPRIKLVESHWDARVANLGTTYTTWDVAPDGKHLAAFLADTAEESKAPTHLTFLFHFGDELQRHAAAGGH